MRCVRKVLSAPGQYHVDQVGLALAVCGGGLYLDRCLDLVVTRQRDSPHRGQVVLHLLPFSARPMKPSICHPEQISEVLAIRSIDV